MIHCCVTICPPADCQRYHTGRGITQKLSHLQEAAKAAIEQALGIEVDRVGEEDEEEEEEEDEEDDDQTAG